MPTGTYPGTSAYGGPPSPYGPGGPLTSDGPNVQAKLEVSADESADTVKLRALLTPRFRACAIQSAKLDPTISGADAFDVRVQTDGKLELIQSKPAQGLAEFDTCAKKMLKTVTLAERASPTKCHIKVVVTTSK